MVLLGTCLHLPTARLAVMGTEPQQELLVTLQ